MNTTTFSHNSGLSHVPPELIEGVRSVVENVSRTIRRGCASKVREEIQNGLSAAGWTGRVTLRANLKASITAMNARVGLCLQTGNMARFYADLLKLQQVFVDGNIDAAIYIVPSKHTAKAMGENIANFERLVRELRLFSKIITMPLVVIGFQE